MLGVDCEQNLANTIRGYVCSCNLSIETLRLGNSCTVYEWKTKDVHGHGPCNLHFGLFVATQVFTGCDNQFLTMELIPVPWNWNWNCIQSDLQDSERASTGQLFTTTTSTLLLLAVCRTRAAHELSLMASLSMSYRGSVDRAPTPCLGGHGFNSRRGLQFFLCPVLVSC